jgi:hypothetical protein
MFAGRDFLTLCTSVLQTTFSLVRSSATRALRSVRVAVR